MNNIKITIANKRDKKQLMIWFKHYGADKFVKKRVDCYIEHNSTIVAKDKNKIVGVLQWHVKEDPNYGVAEMEEVFVSENYRRQGIGSLLVTFAIKTIRKYFTKLKFKPRKIFLFVGKENIAARKLYEKCGFKLVCSVGNLFHDKEEELFYTLDL
jgi:ribosomal protein S18 acetylase RimI-like enzyme